MAAVAQSSAPAPLPLRVLTDAPFPIPHSSNSSPYTARANRQAAMDDSVQSTGVHSSSPLPGSSGRQVETFSQVYQRTLRGRQLDPVSSPNLSSLALPSQGASRLVLPSLPHPIAPSPSLLSQPAGPGSVSLRHYSPTPPASLPAPPPPPRGDLHHSGSVPRQAALSPFFKDQRTTSGNLPGRFGSPQAYGAVPVYGTSQVYGSPSLDSSPSLQRLPQALLGQNGSGSGELPRLSAHASGTHSGSLGQLAHSASGELHGRPGSPSSHESPLHRTPGRQTPSLLGQCQLSHSGRPADSPGWQQGPLLKCPDPESPPLSHRLGRSLVQSAASEKERPSLLTYTPDQPLPFPSSASVDARAPQQQQQQSLKQRFLGLPNKPEGAAAMPVPLALPAALPLELLPPQQQQQSQGPRGVSCRYTSWTGNGPSAQESADILDCIDDDYDEDDVDGLALGQLTMASAEKDSMGLSNPFSWKELERSCRKLDAAHIRIDQIDLTCVAEEDLPHSGAPYEAAPPALPTVDVPGAAAFKMGASSELSASYASSSSISHSSSTFSIASSGRSMGSFAAGEGAAEADVKPAQALAGTEQVSSRRDSSMALFLPQAKPKRISNLMRTVKEKCGLLFTTSKGGRHLSQL